MVLLSRTTRGQTVDKLLDRSLDSFLGSTSLLLCTLLERGDSLNYIFREEYVRERFDALLREVLGVREYAKLLWVGLTLSTGRIGVQNDKDMAADIIRERFFYHACGSDDAIKRKVASKWDPIIMDPEVRAQHLLKRLSLYSMYQKGTLTARRFYLYRGDYGQDLPQDGSFLSGSADDTNESALAYVTSESVSPEELEEFRDYLRFIFADLEGEFCMYSVQPLSFGAHVDRKSLGEVYVAERTLLDKDSRDKLFECLERLAVTLAVLYEQEEQYEQRQTHGDVVQSIRKISEELHRVIHSADTVVVEDQRRAFLRKWLRIDDNQLANDSSYTVEEIPRLFNSRTGWTLSSFSAVASEPDTIFHHLGDYSDIMFKLGQELADGIRRDMKQVLTGTSDFMKRCQSSFDKYLAPIKVNEKTIWPFLGGVHRSPDVWKHYCKTMIGCECNLNANNYVPFVPFLLFPMEAFWYGSHSATRPKCVDISLAYDSGEMVVRLTAVWDSTFIGEHGCPIERLQINDGLAPNKVSARIRFLSLFFPRLTGTGFHGGDGGSQTVFEMELPYDL